MMEGVESWLDQGMGSCVLKDPFLARLLMQAMHHFDGAWYELDAYVVMPNHVHVILRPLHWEEHPLEAILGSWKQFSGRRINTKRGTKRELWQQESYDRIVRDAEHLYRCLQYLARNPQKASLTYQECPLWVRPEWKALGWIFEEPT
jgi:REP element-mobilizing transposase RayT